MNYRDYCIDVTDSIKTAMKAIDILDEKILFITEADKLVATLTDGDIRRYLINGGNLSDTVMEAGNRNPLCASSLDSAKRKFNRRDYIAIPIVKRDRTLVDIYFGDETVPDKEYNLNVPVVVVDVVVDHCSWSLKRTRQVPSL